MTSTATLSPLHQRVREASGPDRELDAELYVLLEVIPNDGRVSTYGPYDPAFSPYLVAGTKIDWLPTTREDAPYYTASIDAALALVERVLPGCRVRMLIMASKTLVNLAEHGVPFPKWSPLAEGATPALAILSALLSAIGRGR